MPFQSVTGKSPALGSAINVVDLTALAAYDVALLTVGTLAYVASADLFYQLKDVANVLTWEVFETGNAEFSGYPVQFYAPTGNNANIGTMNSPKKTGAAAYLALASGGTLRHASGAVFSDGTEGHGLVAGQGLWSNAWLTAFGKISIPGWLPFKDFTVEPWGTPTTDQFSNPVALAPWGQSALSTTTRRDPGLWIVGSNGSTTVKGLSLQGHLPARLGWDYRRNDSDGSIAFADVTHVSRTTATRSVAHATGDNVVANSGVWTFLNGAFVQADVGGVIVVANASNPQNNGSFVIRRVISSTKVQCNKAVVFIVNETFGSSVTCTVRRIPRTVFTVSYPTGWNVISLQRTGNVTTAHVSNTNLVSEVPQAGTGMTLTLNNPPAGFSATNYVSNGYGLFGDDTVWVISWADPGSDTGLVSGSGTTLTTHGCRERSIIEVESSDPQIVTSMYFVESITVNTLTCLDYAGNYGTRSQTYATSPSAGTVRYVLQDRNLDKGICLDEFDGCTFAVIGGGPESFLAGPAVDRGSTTAGGWSWQTRGSAFGNQNADEPVDPNRTAAIFGSGGSDFAGGFQIRDTRLLAGNVRFDAAGGGFGIAAEFLSIDYGGSNSRAGIEILPGSSGGSIWANQVFVSDNEPDTPGIDLGGNPTYGTIANSHQTVNAAASLSPIVLAEVIIWSGATAGFGAARKVGWFGSDMRIAGKRTDIQRNYGLVPGLRGVDNFLPQDLITWTPTGCTVAVSPVRAPNGATTYRVTGTGGSAGTLVPASFTSDVGPLKTGDAYIVGAWMRAVSGGGLTGGGGAVFQLGDPVSGNQIMAVPPPLSSDGSWQWVTGLGYVPDTIDGAATIFFQFNPPGSGFAAWDVWGVTGYRLLASEFPPNEAADVFETFQPTALDIPEGAVSTLPGVKLIGDGGLASGTFRTVGGGGGQITVGSANGNAVEIFGKDGHTRGILELKDYTVNGTPSSPPLTGLQLWLRADNVNTSGGNVTTWPDKSGNGYDVVAVGTLTVTASSVNSQPGVTSAGGAGPGLRNLTDNVMRRGKARTVFAVVKPGETSPKTIVDFRMSTHALALLGGRTGDVIASDGAVDVTATTTPLTSGTPAVMEWHSANQPGGAFSCKVNGSALSLDHGTLTQMDDGGTGFTVMTDNSLTLGFKGDLCELLVFDADLGAIEVAQVNAYLTGRYGIP